jgi:hypothetical protein
MFKMFAIVVNLATNQAQSMIDPEVYPTFERCTAAIAGKYAPAKEVMSKHPPQVLIGLGCSYFEPTKLPGA